MLISKSLYSFLATVNSSIAMKNFEVVRVLRNISILLEMDDVHFKPRAYEKAAISISALEEDVEEIYMKSCVEGFLI